ncbi:hypothetical protein [Vibrio marisflavi]|uniref:Uncharacterized protein n=1 Tax=Vibrio marisflavi CECT 7928 TaxID=634439 RepID=A0ABM8ZYK1_9VIBR|nr:hypothetical protein [Vibrio marisflavi]CAH0536017.1 hypothetical protein VMF7928_00113 [Vibrio marisflavi CECT 7928]
MITTNDPVSRFLKQSGYTPTPHRYLGSDFISGMQVQLNDLDLIYSVEDDTLVISQITATGQSQGLAGAVQNFFKLVHTLEKLNTGISKVKGMVIDYLGDVEENNKLKRLQQAYINQGASYHQENGKTWIIYELRKH